jgi:hypothetical protein
LVDAAITHVGNLKRTGIVYSALSAGMGQHFFANAKWQELASVAERLAGPKETRYVLERDHVLINNMVRVFSNRFINREHALLHETEFSDIFAIYVNDVRERNYVKKFMGANALDTNQLDVLRCRLKSAFKPSNATKGDTTDGVGQPTLCHEPLALVQVQYVMRCVVWMLAKVANRGDLKDKFFLNVYRNADEYEMDAGAAIAQATAMGATHANGDVIKLDKSQDEFDLALFREFCVQNLHMTDELADYLVRLCESPTVTSGLFRMKLYQRFPTGCILTYLLNTMCCAIKYTYRFDWDGLAVLLSQGDDDDLTAVNLRINSVRQMELYACSKTRFTDTIDDAANYCGKLLVGEFFVPDFYRMFCKFTAKRCRNWSDFLEYQQSMKENIQSCLKSGLTRVFAASILNRDISSPFGRVKVSPNEMECMFEVYVSWAFASKRTYDKYVKQFRFEEEILNADKEISLQIYDNCAKRLMPQLYFE